MADISFADVKVHNEVEFCTITDLNVKKQLERLFLDERISYYEKWDDVSFFKRVFAGGEKSKCTLCINEMQRDKAEEILEAHHMDIGRRLIQDYDFIMDRAAEAEELGANHRPSTLERLASLANAKEKCDAPECSPVGCRKVRDAREL